MVSSLSAVRFVPFTMSLITIFALSSLLKLHVPVGLYYEAFLQK